MLHSQPLISVITPSYNQGDFVEETIKSVLNQSYTNIEYIFIDGGSTDRTMNIVEKYKDKIRIIIHEKDKGQTDAINKGFKLAKGELVGWVNSDDILYSDCVENIVALYDMNKTAAVFYHSYNDMINESGSLIKTYQHKIPNRKHLLFSNYDVIQQGSFYNLGLVKKVGYLDIENHYCMDLDLWLKLSMQGEIIYTADKPHSAFRIYSGTKTDTGKEDFLNNIYTVLKKHGAKFYFPTVWHKIYIYKFKLKIKRWLNK
ncbi:MAG: glycosyltransferase [Ignavibacteriaceae bacterium]|nr:glycosyltransferase [Ignavibacteriaceae bacterium]